MLHFRNKPAEEAKDAEKTTLYQTWHFGTFRGQVYLRWNYNTFKSHRDRAGTEGVIEITLETG